MSRYLWRMRTMTLNLVRRLPELLLVALGFLLVTVASMATAIVSAAAHPPPRSTMNTPAAFTASSEFDVAAAYDKFVCDEKVTRSRGCLTPRPDPPAACRAARSHLGTDGCAFVDGQCASDWPAGHRR